MSTAFGIAGLLVTLAGALVMGLPDLLAKQPTWDSLVSEWVQRRRFAGVGAILIAVGSGLQVVGLASS